MKQQSRRRVNEFENSVLDAMEQMVPIKVYPTIAFRTRFMVMVTAKTVTISLGATEVCPPFPEEGEVRSIIIRLAARCLGKSAGDVAKWTTQEGQEEAEA